jgi:putative DNA primase/helicase
MAAQEIVRRLNSEECQAQSVRVLDPPEGVSEGWDVTDAVREAWPLQRWKAFLRGAHTVGPNAAGTLRVSAPGAGPSVACSGTETRDVQTQAQKNGAEAPVPAESAEEPFRILGHNHGIFYYRPHSTLSIVGLSAGQHKKLELLVLAPALYWEQRFPGRDGTDWFAVANNLIQRCKKREFDPGLIRGRGAVLDAKRVVFHKGGSLLVDGVEVALESFQSQWIYQRGLPLQVDLAAPLPAEKAARLLELTECFPFRRSVDAMLLAGWLAMAPVAGALEWRPHLWLSVSVR